MNNGQPQAPDFIGGVAVQQVERRDWGIDMDTLLREWRTSKDYTDKATKDFPSIDQIVDGIPITTQSGAPYVGDTTLPGLVRQIPRESLQQVPLFAAVVNGTKRSIKAYIGSYILRRGVFNEDTFGKGILSTMQIGGEQALAHGYAPFMCATGTMYDEFGTTMRLLHYSDVGVEPGISDFYESGYFYVEANLTKSRVRRILKSARNNPNTTWNVPGLERLLESDPVANPYSIYQTAARQDPNQNAPTYKFVTRYETGKQSEFVTFCPQLEDEPLRVLENKSKFGYPRVLSLVIDPAPLTPWGVSRVRLASPNANLKNAFYQNVGSMLILNSKPPVLKRGRFTKPVQLKSGVVWETLDNNASVELKELSNSTLQSFPEMSRQLDQQIMNMMGKPARNTNYGNTSPGAKQSIKEEDYSVNQITNIMENFLRQYALVALDTYVSEQVSDDPEQPNIDHIILDDEAKDAINRLGEEEFVSVPDTEADPDGTLGIMTEYVPIVGDDNVIEVNWNEYYDSIKSWSVEIELSIGKQEMEEKERGDLQDTLVTMTQNANPEDTKKQQKIDQVEDRLLEKMVPDMKRQFGQSTSSPQPVENSAGDQMTTNTEQ